MREDIKERIEKIKRGEVPEGYKKTEAGIVPITWEKQYFKNLFKEKKIMTNEVDKYPLYSLTIENGVVEKSDRYDREHLVKKDEDVYKIVEKNNFAYNPMNIRFGAVARNKTNKEVCVSGYYDVFEVVNEEDMEYMDDYLVSYPMIKYFNRVCTGSLDEKKRVHFSQFLEFRLPMPSMSEREKISKILCMVNKKIYLQENLILNKIYQKKYMSRILLTGKKRINNFSEEWKTIKCRKLFEIGSKEKVINTSEYKKITIKLNFGGIEFLNSKREMSDTRPFYIRRKNEIIIGKQNYFNGSIAMVSEKFDGTICSNAIMSFTVNEKYCDKYFVFYYLSQPDFLKEKSCMANGTGQKELSEKDFLDFEIMVPSIDEQRGIANIIKEADKEIELLEQQLEEIKLEKKAMMQLLLTGIVRVNQKGGE